MIRMYNFGFGDCFKLENDGFGDLYVDCGIHTSSMNETEREKRYDIVKGDLTNNCDFLLTHYHDDHYAGAIYLSGKSKKFRNVYIPDVWSINGSVDVVKLILLRGLITKSVIENGMSVISFLKSICSSTGKVFFIKRESEIQDKYIALWPEEGWMSKRAKAILNKLPVDGKKWADLTSLAEKLIRIVLRLGEVEGLDAKLSLTGELGALEEEYRTLAEEFESDKNLQHKLSKYGNEISIVFQNKSKKDRNVLFTGDVGQKSVWKFLEGNKDGKISMHDKYKVIKIPHHGTKGYKEHYYHSFCTRMNGETTLLIPNGNIVYTTWRIHTQYSADANTKNCRVICADKNACNATTVAAGGVVCNCHNCTLANNSNQYVDV